MGNALKLAETGCRILDLKSDVVDAAKNNVKAARKMMLKARYTAEELADTATLCVRRHPMRAVCGTFGAAFAIGVMAGWFATRRSS